MRRLRILLAYFLLLSLFGCGGNGAPASMPQALGEKSASILVPLSTLGTTFTLPTAGGFSGTAFFPALETASTIEVSTSTTAPAGSSTAAAIARRAQSGTLTEFFYFSLTPNTTITLPTLPSFTLGLPPTYPSSGKQYYYAISQPAQSGVYAEYRTEGPGSLLGHSVTFDATAQPLTLHAGTTYIFAFYAISTNNVSAAPLLYVANAGSNAITVYPLTARGDASPTRTISGPQTGLVHPIAITADTEGNLIVANAVSATSSTIETFAEGASGNVPPIRTFTVPVPVTQLAVDPKDASIYAGASAFGLVNNYSVTGHLMRSLSNFSGSIYSGYVIFGLAVDAHDNLIVGGDLSNKDFVNCQDEVYPPNASGTTPYLYSLTLDTTIPHAPDCLAVAYALKIDHVFSIGNDGEAIFDQPNISKAKITRSADYAHDNGTQPLLTVDPSGQAVFIGGAGVNSILPLTGTSTGFTPEPLIAGPNTGLADPTSMTIGRP